MLNLSVYLRGLLPAEVAGETVRSAEPGAVVEMSSADLPAACPGAAMPLWTWHPRVFLDVVHQSEAMCPYCGTRYRLHRDVRLHDHEFGARCLHQHLDFPSRQPM